jgi:alkylhydroperoxidase/carboxymuconolactone decarboxylase family protein YurZ
MAGFAAGHDALAFAQAHWAAHLPGLDAAAAYAEALARLRGTALPETTAELAMLAVQAARGSTGGTAHHLRRAYALGIAEERMAEALSYLIWPAGVNCFLEACTIWHGMMRAGELTPSPRFAAWAEMPGMGAYDAQAGKPVGGFDSGD